MVEPKVLDTRPSVFEGQSDSKLDTPTLRSDGVLRRFAVTNQATSME